MGGNRSYWRVGGVSNGRRSRLNRKCVMKNVTRWISRVRSGRTHYISVLKVIKDFTTDS